MKVGILTFHNTNNYGASLQSYALCKYLNSINIDAEIIDYQNSKMKNDLLKVYKIPEGFLNKLKYYLLYKSKSKKKMKEFQDFKKYYKLSNDNYDENSNLSKIANNYDYIVVGSDQVWNYNITQNDWNFFLQFAPKEKRVSYAASIGLDEIDKDIQPIIKRLLVDFNHISVREEKAKEIVFSLTQRKAELVVDPTLLLKKEDWGKIVGKRKIRENYILLYSFGLTDSMLSFAQKLSEQKNMKIVQIDGSLKNMLKKRWVSARGYGPQSWVNLFYYADYIITNSFHGTAFSINFEKQFFIELLPPPAKVNSRLINIINTFGLQSRFIDNINDDTVDEKIDYETVKNKLNSLRSFSAEFIERFVNVEK